MEELLDLLDSNPNTHTINLEFSQIQYLDPFIPTLQKFPKLQQLLLFGNRLQTLPKTLPSLSTLQKLDISNNLLDNLSEFLPILQKLPLLKELHITLQSEQDQQRIISSLNLTHLNGTEIEHEQLQESQGKQDSIDYNQEGTHLTQHDLEKVANLYDQVRGFWKAAGTSHDSKLAQDFDKHVKLVMGNLSLKLTEQNPAYIVHAHMLKAKHDLFLICQQKVSELIANQNPNLGTLVIEINKDLGSFMGELIGIFQDISPKYQSKIKNLEVSLQKSMKQTADVLAAAEQIQKEAEQQSSSLKSDKTHLQEHIDELYSEIESLREQNKNYLDTIIKNSKESATQALLDRTPEDQTYSRQNVSQALPMRSLTLKQLKDIIQELYLSKTKYDQRCIQNKLPKETMEQHMYTYLNQKYGLKTLVIEWAASIIQGIKNYISDPEVAVLGKILKNECDQDFRLVIMQVKDTVVELLRMHIRGKFPLKSNNDLHLILQEKLNGFVSQDEWVEIVRYMYNETDAEFLITIIKETIQAKEYSVLNESVKSKSTREEMYQKQDLKGKIHYSDLIKVLLDFQIQGHEKFLENFIKLFKRVDRDTNGILNEKEFQDLLASVDVRLLEEQGNKMLTAIDPYNNQQITFTECVSLFLSQTVILDSNPNEKIPILQKLSMR